MSPDARDPGDDANDLNMRREPVLRLTPQEWRTVLERRSFLEREDNRFQTPRRFCGHPVQIVPDDSFR